MNTPSLLKEDNFITSLYGSSTEFITLKNSHSSVLQVTNLGARIVSLWIKDSRENFRDIVLGYDTIDKYINNQGERYLGCVVGRYANRIANGMFTLDGTTYQLPINNGKNCLHGGIKGLDMVLWSIKEYSDDHVLFEYISKDGADGFPGALTIKLRYDLTDKNELKIQYKASTDKSTPVNLTHHSYFNLKGEGNGTINDHIMTIYADSFVPVNNDLIPLGELRSVSNTPLDFRKPTKIGLRIDDQYEQLVKGSGYDHTWVLRQPEKRELVCAASVWSPESGISMSVSTTEPGMQFYSGNFFDGKTTSKNGLGKYERRGAFALETQHFPDSPNQPNFPNTILHPKESYEQTCCYAFEIKK